VRLLNSSSIASWQTGPSFIALGRLCGPVCGDHVTKTCVSDGGLRSCREGGLKGGRRVVHRRLELARLAGARAVG